MDTEMEQLYTMEQVAERLAVAESWIRTEVQSGRFPHYRIGEKQRIRFTAGHVQQYLSQREQGTAR